METIEVVIVVVVFSLFIIAALIVKKVENDRVEKEMESLRNDVSILSHKDHRTSQKLEALEEFLKLEYTPEGKTKPKYNKIK